MKNSITQAQFGGAVRIVDPAEEQPIRVHPKWALVYVFNWTGTDQVTDILLPRTGFPRLRSGSRMWFFPRGASGSGVLRFVDLDDRYWDFEAGDWVETANADCQLAPGWVAQFWLRGFISGGAPVPQLLGSPVFVDSEPVFVGYRRTAVPVTLLGRATAGA